MKTKLLTIAIVGCLVFVLSGWTMMLPPLDPTVTENFYSGSVNEYWFNECTAEAIHMTGDWNLYLKLETWPDGLIKYTLQSIDLNLVHVGLSSRNVIHTAGVTSYRYFENGGQSIFDIFRIEDSKSKHTYFVHIHYHWFVNERGDVDVSFDDIYATRD